MEKDYFNLFYKMAEDAVDASIELHRCTADYDKQNFFEQVERQRLFLQSGDIIRRDLARRVKADCMPPFSPADLTGLADSLQSVTAGIYNAVLEIYYSGLPVLPGEAVEFSLAVLRCCGALKRLNAEFLNPRSARLATSVSIGIESLAEEKHQRLIGLIKRVYESRDIGNMLCLRKIMEALCGCIDNCLCAAQAAGKMLSVL